MPESRAYYNENDPRAAQWLRELISINIIAPGDVDERSIEDIAPNDLVGYSQCHFFAGIGGWSYALRLAGWPDDRPVWSGSCPCQPFSAAGKRAGFDDERHLWPIWRRLISQCSPPIIFGEQVAHGIGGAWFDVVHTDLEAQGYAVGSAVLGAHSAGAPHIRQRRYFVADACGARGGGNTGTISSPEGRAQRGLRSESNEPQFDSKAGDVALSLGERCERGAVTRVEDAKSADRLFSPRSGQDSIDFWSACEWLPCRDDKARPVEPGTFPLAHGVSGRVGLLRGYGNAIVPQVAQVFIESYMQIEVERHSTLS